MWLTSKDRRAKYEVTVCENPTWREPETREPYHYDFRTCSYCGGIHPEDALVFIAAGCQVEGTTKGYKRYLRVPNKLAGKKVQCGGEAGPLWWGEKLPWYKRLFAPASTSGMGMAMRAAGGPSIIERLRGKYNRPMYGLAPAFTSAKIYNYHFNETQLAKYNLLVERSMASARNTPEQYQTGGVL